MSNSQHLGVAAGRLVSTTTDALTAQLTSATRWLWIWLIFCAASVIVGFAFPWFFIVTLLALAVAIVGFLLKRVILEYEGENEATVWWTQLGKNWSKLVTTRGRWRLESSTHLHLTYHQKTNAGANSLVKRHALSFGLNTPVALKLSAPTPTIRAKRHSLVFLPDRVLVKSGWKWNDVEYIHLDVRVFQTRFVESGAPPRDGNLIGQTWQYVNVNGGPDRRFKNNRTLPVMLYGEVVVSSDTGLNWIIQLSRADSAQLLSDSLNKRRTMR